MIHVPQASRFSTREPAEVLVDGLSHDGRGLSRVQGKTLFIDGALPGEKVLYRVIEERRRFANVRVQSVLEASPQRVEPPCHHFKQCGGCSLQYWSHQGQLEGKQAIVLDQFQRFSSKVVVQAHQWMQPTAQERILDLYCGLGNFSLALAWTVDSVTGVEGGEGAVTRASHNAFINQLTNCRFFQGDLSKPSRGEPWLRDQYDALLLDPPRTGALEIIESMGAQLPNKVLYISCNPATLARDAGALAGAGFTLLKLGVMDMFPQTSHVESMALFLK